MDAAASHERSPLTSLRAGEARVRVGLCHVRWGALVPSPEPRRVTPRNYPRELSIDRESAPAADRRERRYCTSGSQGYRTVGMNQLTR